MAMPKLDLGEITYKPGAVDYKVLDQIFKNDYQTFDEAEAKQRQAEVADLQYEKVKRGAAEDKAHEELRERIKEVSAGGLGEDDDDSILRKVRDSAYELGDLDTGIKVDTQLETRKQRRVAKDIAQYNALMRQDPEAAKTWAETKGLDAYSNLNVRQRINPFSGLSVYDPSTGEAVEMVAPRQRAPNQAAQALDLYNPETKQTIRINGNDLDKVNRLYSEGWEKKYANTGEDLFGGLGEPKPEGPGLADSFSSMLGSLAGKNEPPPVPGVIPKAAASRASVPPPPPDPSKETREEYKRRVRGF